MKNRSGLEKAYMNEVLSKVRSSDRSAKKSVRTQESRVKKEEKKATFFGIVGPKVSEESRGIAEEEEEISYNEGNDALKKVIYQQEREISRLLTTLMNKNVIDKNTTQKREWTSERLLVRQTSARKEEEKMRKSENSGFLKPKSNSSRVESIKRMGKSDGFKRSNLDESGSSITTAKQKRPEVDLMRRSDGLNGSKRRTKERLAKNYDRVYNDEWKVEEKAYESMRNWREPKLGEGYNVSDSDSDDWEGEMAWKIKEIQNKYGVYNGKNNIIYNESMRSKGHGTMKKNNKKVEENSWRNVKKEMPWALATMSRMMIKDMADQELARKLKQLKDHHPTVVNKETKRERERVENLKKIENKKEKKYLGKIYATEREAYKMGLGRMHG